MSAGAGSAIAVFGGTFDPVHFGHLRPAVEVAEALGLARVHMLPSARPPHRTAPVAAPEHRLAMLEHAIAGERLLHADDRELKRDGPSYMVDTLEDLREDRPDAPILLVIGQDAANDLDSWHRWRDLFELAHVVIMRRPGLSADYNEVLAGAFARREAAMAEDLLARPAGLTFTLSVSQLDISATAIRGLVRMGRSLAYLTPPAVAEYIADHGLYAAAPPA